MTSKSIPVEKADSIDLEHLGQTVATHGYELILARQKQMIENWVAQLLSEQDLCVIYRLQGKIDGLRRALDVPAILAKELAE